MKIKKIVGFFYHELHAWIKLIICIWPEGPVGRFLRHHYWKRVMHLPNAFYMHRQARLMGGNLLSIGKDFNCGEGSTINACDSEGIFIGNHVLLAPYVYMRSANHRFDQHDKPINQQGHTYKKLNHAGKTYSIVIEDDVWIGAYATILSGARIGKGSVIGAHAVVAKDIPPYSIVIGNPARIIKSRQPELTSVTA